jgi:hypothetical protein
LLWLGVGHGLWVLRSSVYVHSKSQSIVHILQICDEMLRRRDDLAPFIDSDFDAYVADMQTPHMWADEPEV